MLRLSYQIMNYNITFLTSVPFVPLKYQNHKGDQRGEPAETWEAIKIQNQQKPSKQPLRMRSSLYVLPQGRGCPCVWKTCN